MISILGIDAAWTSTEPSGVALVAGEGSEWRTLCVAPSYEAFIARASGHKVDWQSGSFNGSVPDVRRLLTAARSIAGIDANLVAVDMPLATVPITGRRKADRAISQAFGARGCSTHSPSTTHPGPTGTKLMADLTNAGFTLFTSSVLAPLKQGLIEVYPHPALLVLLDRAYRVPYKVSKSSKYWKNASVTERISNLLVEFNHIERGLRRVFGDTLVSLPSASQVRTLHSLKRYEDALDALLSAWVGCMFTVGAAAAYGDSTAAIWVPFRQEVERPMYL